MQKLAQRNHEDLTFQISYRRTLHRGVHIGRPLTGSGLLSGGTLPDVALFTQSDQV